MTANILILLVGLALVVFGADWLVDGASAIARKTGVSEFVIGLTIVGFGTSMPELVVSLTGAIQGVSDIAIGNVVGSNVFNTLLILGTTALIVPIGVTEKNRKDDIPITLAITLMLICIGMSGTLFGIGGDRIPRIGGVVFLAVFALYMYCCFKTDSAEPQEEAGKTMKIWVAALLSVAGIAGLIVGGKLFVGSAQKIAQALGLSERFIAITVLAGGTSLPELVTCVVAAFKKKGQLALGNILGSNIFNILLILGCSAVVTPLSLAGMGSVDLLAILLSMCLLYLCTFTGDKNKIDRWEGLVLLLGFTAYYVWLFLRK